MRLFDWLRRPAQAAAPDGASLEKRYERYWAMRRHFRESGVYDDVIIDVVPYGAFPAFDHNKRAEIMLVSEAGELQHFSVAKDGRVWVPLRDVPYEDEPAALARLKAELPGADYRAVWDCQGIDALRGYYAFRYPV